MLYDWRGPEKHLASACVAVRLTVESIEEKENGEWAARGTIRGKDYVEHGIEFEDPWEATGQPYIPGELNWIVRRADDGQGFWRDGRTGEFFFTMNEDVNRAIKKFIARHLNAFLARRGEGREAAVIVEEPPKYTGPRAVYSGPCVCAELERANSHPFPWTERTDGGQFPMNCFACSCGRNWWLAHPAEGVWRPVTDPAAWAMLCEYNGVAVRSVVEFDGGIQLLQTVRNNGFVPVG